MSNSLPDNIKQSTLFQRAVADYLDRTDQSIGDLDDAKFMEIALSVRSLAQVLKDGAKAVESRVAVTLGRRVSLQVYEERKAGCKSNKCGKCIISKQGNIVCAQCGCSGQFMDAALWDPKESCRLPEGKIWDKVEEPVGG